MSQLPLEVQILVSYNLRSKQKSIPHSTLKQLQCPDPQQATRLVVGSHRATRSVQCVRMVVVDSRRGRVNMVPAVVDRWWDVGRDLSMSDGVSDGVSGAVSRHETGRVGASAVAVSAVAVAVHGRLVRDFMSD